MAVKNTGDHHKLSGLNSIILMVAVAVLYFATARLSLLLAVGNTNVTSVWPPSGIALAAILLWGYRMGPAIFLGAFFANVLVLKSTGLEPSYYLVVSLATAIGNMLEGMVGAYFIRRLAAKDNPFNTLKDLFVFIVFGSLLATLVSASVGAGSYCFATLQWPVFPHLLMTWWLADAAGILIVTPIIILLKNKVLPVLHLVRYLEAACVWMLLIVSSTVIFGYGYRLEYMIIPPLLWMALRFGRLCSAVSVFLVSVLAIICTIHGAGPQAGQASQPSLLYLQTYIGVISIVTLCLSVLTYDLRHYKEHLEEIIKERSASLVAANDQLRLQIEERDWAKTALSDSERKYRDLVESANSVIMRWRPDGSITFFNTYAQTFFGFTEPEIIGKNMLGSIVPVLESSGRDLSALIEDIIRNPDGHAFNENENVMKNGRTAWIAWTNKPIFDESGTLTEILSVGNDITKRKHIEESLRKTLDELARAKERAEAADRIKSSILATMSHELRTPLNSIIGFTGIILQGLAGPLNDEQKKQMGMVRNSSRHLLSLINDVLDISKIEAGQLDVSAEPFNLRATLEKSAATLKPAAEKKGLTLGIQIGADLESVVGDPRRVEQVLLNLLNNAVKFTERGTIELCAAIITDYRPPYASQASNPTSAVKVSVADTGIGIRPEDLCELFQPFRQVDTGLARKNEGTGLGLAICRRLAELMGGEINAASVWGKGSTFTFILPLKGKAKP